MFYVSVIVMRKQNSRYIKDTEKGIKPYHMENNQFTKGDRKRGRRNKRTTKQLENNKSISKSLPINHCSKCK